VSPSPSVESPPVAEQIRALVKKGVLSLPPLPELATRLLQLLRDEDRADLSTAGELIENEPVMAASVLRMANSASFGGLRRLSDLGEAIGRLGLRQVSSLVTAVAHRGNFECTDAERMKTLRTLWDHAVATALVSKSLAAQGGGDMAESFLAGLLHDTGKLLVLKGADHLETHAGSPPLSPATVDELMDLLHCELGFQTLTQWKLPEPICRVAQHHHDPEPAAGDLLLARVQVGSAVARKLGAHLHPDPELNLLELPAVERLSLSDLEVASLMVDVEEEYARVRQLF
jgi:HD-like signal output (HDOD) protein